MGYAYLALTSSRHVERDVIAAVYNATNMVALKKKAPKLSQTVYKKIKNNKNVNKDLQKFANLCYKKPPDGFKHTVAKLYKR